MFHRDVCILFYMNIINILMNKQCFYCFPVEKQATPAQVKDHRGAVLDIIELYLTGKFLKLVNVQTKLHQVFSALRFLVHRIVQLYVFLVVFALRSM